MADEVEKNMKMAKGSGRGEVETVKKAEKKEEKKAEKKEGKKAEHCNDWRNYKKIKTVCKECCIT